MPLAEFGYFVGKSVLVTGGAGFIGSHLTEYLVGAGANVTVVDNLRTGCLANLDNCADEIEYIHDDILHATFGALVASKEFDVIFHFAANPYVPPSVKQPWLDFEINAIGTLKLLETLRQSGQATRLVVASSAAVYGDIESASIDEDAPTVPISPYGVSKLAVDRYAAVYAHLYDLRIASLRLFSVYGPRQRKQVVYDFIRKLSSGSDEVYALGDGSQIRDFTYVADVVRAALWVAQAGSLCGEVYNVASGEPCTIRELLDTLCELMDIQPHIAWSGNVRPGDPQRWLPSISRLKALGWQPTVHLREGLERTLSWYRSGQKPVFSEKTGF